MKEQKDTTKFGKLYLRLLRLLTRDAFEAFFFSDYTFLKLQNNLPNFEAMNKIKHMN